MTTLWVTGAGGVVGQKLVDQAVAAGRYDRICAWSHRAPGGTISASPVVQRGVLDIGDRESLLLAARAAAPDVVINPAAMTNVDACETQRTEARRANAEGPGQLADVCRARGAHLIHVSTDYVFPGDEAQPGPYTEDAIPRPINYYGQTKLDGERAVAERCAGDAPYTVVRTALVYGLVPGARTNFVTWLTGELRAGRRVRIVRDQWNTPTLADDLAHLLLWLAERGTTGTYHAAGPEVVGRDEWALAIAGRFGLDTGLIDWVTTAALAQPAPRPRFSGLRCARLEEDIARGAPRPRGIADGLATISWLTQP
jgi:dTDP-4-dehydrorhamnose reductase